MCGDGEGGELKDKTRAMVKSSVRIRVKEQHMNRKKSVDNVYQTSEGSCASHADNYKPNSGSQSLTIEHRT